MQARTWRPGRRGAQRRRPSSRRLGPLNPPPNTAAHSCCQGCAMRGPGRKCGTPVSGWQQQLVSRIEVPGHAPQLPLPRSKLLNHRLKPLTAAALQVQPQAGLAPLQARAGDGRQGAGRCPPQPNAGESALSPAGAALAPTVYLRPLRLLLAPPCLSPCLPRGQSAPSPLTATGPAQGVQAREGRCLDAGRRDQIRRTGGCAGGQGKADAGRVRRRAGRHGTLPARPRPIRWSLRTRRFECGGAVHSLKARAGCFFPGDQGLDRRPAVAGRVGPRPCSSQPG